MEPLQSRESGSKVELLQPIDCSGGQVKVLGRDFGTVFKGKNSNKSPVSVGWL